MENHNFQWVNPQIQWPFSSSQTVINHFMACILPSYPPRNAMNPRPLTSGLGELRQRFGVKKGPAGRTARRQQVAVGPRGNAKNG